MKILNVLPILLALVTIQIWSCAGAAEEEQKTKNLLHGRWELKEGFRNNRPTESVTGTFFEFSDEDQMIYNLGGSREVVTYVLDGKNITPEGSRLNTSFIIEELTEQQLTLSMNMRNVPFKFILAKAGEGAE